MPAFFTIASSALLAATASAAVAQAGCNNPGGRPALLDACFVTVRATAAGLYSSRLADCSSYLRTTVAGSTTTTTITVTPTVTSTAFSTQTITSIVATSTTTAANIQRNLMKRDVTNTVPAYAAAVCTGTKYSSACACAGATASTVTAPGPISTLTVTAPVVTSTITATTQSVVQSTSTTTIAAAYTGYPCGSQLSGNGQFPVRRYNVACAQRVTGKTPNYYDNYSSESDCLRLCNSISNCIYAEYQFSTGLCNIYYTAPQTVVADLDWDALKIAGG